MYRAASGIIREAWPDTQVPAPHKSWIVVVVFLKALPWLLVTGVQRLLACAASCAAWVEKQLLELLSPAMALLLLVCALLMFWRQFWLARGQPMGYLLRGMSVWDAAVFVGLEAATGMVSGDKTGGEGQRWAALVLWWAWWIYRMHA